MKQDKLDSAKRHKTSYPGVFYREAERIGGPGTERVYYIVFKKNGKVIEEKAGRQYVDDLTPARVARIRAERIEGKRLSRKEIRAQEESKKQEELNRWTISKLWHEYKEKNPHVKAINKDEDRFNCYLAKPFGQKEPKDLVPLDVDRVRITLLKTLKPATVKNSLELLRRIINFGVKKHLCPGINFTIQMPVVHNLKTEDLSAEQLVRLIKAIDEDANIQVADIMRMALFTGMRKGEIFRLKWQHIDSERGFIHIADPKGGPDQTIPLNDGARVVLERHPKDPESEYVFPGHDGGFRRNAHRVVNRIKAAAGLPKDFRPLHGLRHVYASMLASSGQVDLFTLQKLLTHKSPLMTQRYAHLRDEALRKASDLAGDIISQAVNGKDKVINLPERE